MPVIVSSTKSTFIIGFEEHQDLLLFNVINKSMSMIKTEFPYSKMRVAVNDKLLATCMDPIGNFGEPISTTMKVFDIKEQKLLLEEKTPDFIGFSTDNLSNSSMIALIHCKKLEILILNEDNMIERYTIPLNIEKLFIISTMHPYTYYCEIFNENAENEGFSSTVWKYEQNQNTMKIVDYISIENFYNFVFNNGETRKQLFNATYIKEDIYLFAISYTKYTEMQCITRIVKSDGQKLRDLHLDVFQVSNQETVFYKYNEKLFIERESFFVKENAIFQFYVEELTTRSKEEKIFEKELADIQQSNLNGYLNYVFNKYFITSARISRQDGDILIILKTLDFWINMDNNSIRYLE